MENSYSERLKQSLKGFWNNLPEEKKEAVMKAHEYFVSHGIIADAFAAAGTPINILQQYYTTNWKVCQVFYAKIFMNLTKRLAEAVEYKIASPERGIYQMEVLYE